MPELGDTGTGRDVLWRFVDGVGLEHARLLFIEDGPHLAGTVITTADGEPATVQYAVQCDRHWHTREVIVTLVRASTEVPATVHLLSDGDGMWTRIVEREGSEHREPIAIIRGCIDIDLGFSPSTNTLPIRRLNMVAGANTKITAAWIKFPSLEITTLPQRYTNLGHHMYKYESFPHRFTARVEIDDLGLVTNYQGVWERIGESTFGTETHNDEEFENA